MTKEISKEVIAKVFAQHIGNNVSYAYLLGDREHFTTGKLVGVYLDSEGYWMLKCLDFNGNIIEVDIDEGQARLEMLDLSDISDEDAVEVAKIVSKGIACNGYTRRCKGNFWCCVTLDGTKTEVRIVFTSGIISSIISICNVYDTYVAYRDANFLPAYDFLRSRGYMLPAFGITDLFEAGIAVRKNKEV